MKKQISLLTMLIVCVAYTWANETDELTYTSFFTACTSSGSNTSGSYTNFSDKSGSESDAVYAGNIYKHGNGPSNCKDYIQLRTSSNSGIYTTTSGGKAKKVTIEWNAATTTTRTVQVYGKNTAYSAVSDLFDNDKKGTLLGSITWASPTPGTELTITGDYDYIGIRSSDGSLYLNSISIEWSTKTLSSIVKKTDATKKKYIAGETFAPAGMYITATYSDASTEDIAYTGNEAKFSFSPTTATALTTSNTEVTITYGGKSTGTGDGQAITVYSITMQAKDEDGNAMGVGAPGAPTFTASTRTITAAANAANYVFKEWVVSNAAATSSTTTPTTITSADPTGNVTVTAKYYKPISVGWKVNGENWTPSNGGGTDGTATVGYGTAWSTLTLPTDPRPGTDEDACGNKFIGWTDSEIDGELDKDDDAAAITALNSNILNSSTKSGKTSTYITTATTFHAVFADYAE